VTNEELALHIQSGERELYNPLWEQNMGLMHRLAHRYEGLGRHYGLEYDDLLQCCYLALYRAVEAYQEEKGYKLTAYLAHSMRRVLRDYTNIDGREECPIMDSLNRPIEQEDADAAELGELIPDPAASAAFEDAVEREYTRQLHDDLEACLEQIEPEPAQVIRLRYWKGLSPSPSQKKMERKGMVQLRKCNVRWRLDKYREEILSHHWFQSGLSSFLNAQASAVELATEHLDRLAEA